MVFSVKRAPVLCASCLILPINFKVLKVVEGVGFEPTYAKRPDLQSGGFNHSPTPPQAQRRGRGGTRQLKSVLAGWKNGVYSLGRLLLQHLAEGSFKGL